MTTHLRTYRIGQIVPSSNTTMETEVPAMLRAREALLPERFSFHSSRMRMRHVTVEELERMDDESVRCAEELADARCDVLGYACLVAIMSRGAGYHRKASARLQDAAHRSGMSMPVVTSAGALLEGLRTLRARRVALIAPYMPPLAHRVVEYIEHEGFEVVDHLALGIADNLEVGRRNPQHLLADLDRLDWANADVVVLSACVQMPSLAAIVEAEKIVGRPTISAAVCTTHQILGALQLAQKAPDAGALLA